METTTVYKWDPKLVCNGRQLREMFCAATLSLEKNASEINALNVFPVPDGDTGTNMLLTMRSTMAEAARPPDTSASDIAQAMARGALMGARGNSGVILSQMLKGFAAGLEGHESFGPADMAHALEQACKAAYEGLSRPREGTMLTVMRDAATAAQTCIRQDNHNLLTLMEMVVEEARKSVERTPELLEVLREAGVVDAGGQGIYVILEGIVHYLNGDEEQSSPFTNEKLLIKKESLTIKQPAFIAARQVAKKEKAYGYCTELILKGENLDQAQIRRWVESQGESVLVVGDQQMVKVHVHTLHPGTVVEFGISLGTLHDLKIENMDDQNEEFLQAKRTSTPASEVSVIAVVSGKGLEDVFCSLGTSAIVSGGQTMNPSCAEILQAIDSVPSNQVIILPNNKNIIPTARQAAGVTRKNVKVLPTKSVPQGLSALVGYNNQADMDSNYREMLKSQEKSKSIEITTAVRDARMGVIQVTKDDFIGIVDGNIKVAGKDLDETTLSALEVADIDKAEILTLFYGDQVNLEETKGLSNTLKEHFPELEIELIHGGQPHYPYIISVE